MAECFAGGHLRFVDGEWRDDNGNVVEIEPVVHAYWQLYKDEGHDNRSIGWRCSHCRRYHFHNGAMRKKYKRCPNCGARMRVNREATDEATQRAWVRSTPGSEGNTMRAYVLYQPTSFSYPEDMQKILDYLQARGELNVQPATVEDFYFEFSEVKYAAGWIGVNIVTLEEFAEWLSKQEI